MKTRFTSALSKPGIIVAFVSIVGGGVAGWFAAQTVVNPRFDRLERLWRERPSSVATGTARTVEVVPLERRPLAPLYPEGLVTQRLSPTVLIVRRVSNKVDERPVTREQVIGNAVALTSDGWLTTSHSVLANVRASEVVIAANGRTYPVEKIVRDVFTDLVYLKTDADDLGVAAFERPQDVVAGMGAWLEASPKRYYPQSIIDARLENSGSLSSERAVRRFIVSGSGESVSSGTAVWSSSGRLIGLVEAKSPAGWRVIPAGNIAAALSSLLEKGVIEHSSLGIYAIDLSTLTLEGKRESLPLRGVWVKNDKKGAAVIPNGPSAKLVKEGDVIERVERDILDGTVDIGELLLDYRPSSTVTLYGTRGREDFQVEVNLRRIVASEVIK